MPIDDIYMRRCLELAANGLGRVAPNPMVGCVIVYNGRIIGEGFHQRYGGPHAEANAIASVKEPSLLPHSTLYVNLEPCSHVGKTPPCADLIINSRISKVVVSVSDPFSKVSGRGIQRLRDNGVQVTMGVLAQESAKLNRRFFIFHQRKRPYIILKWAQTADGFIDMLRPEGAQPHPTWITSEKLRMLVHKWRSEESAIMVGTTTALLDDPGLNVRDWHGNQPVRIVIDKTCSLPDTLKLFNGQQPTLVYNLVKHDQVGQTRWVRLSDSTDMLAEILSHLHSENIQSVFVEGGRHLLQSCIDNELYDEARIFTGPQFFGQGCRAPLIGHQEPSQIILGNENFFWHETHRYEHGINR